MRTRFHDLLATIPLLIVAFFFMLPLTDGGFLTDDYHNIRFATFGPEGGGFFDPEDPTEVLAYFHKPATERYELYRPLVPMSFRLSYEYAGTAAKPYIVANIILHLLGGLLSVFLMRTLVPEIGRVPMLFGVALFLLSPLQTQVAYWSSARSDSLCWIFGALALISKWPDRRRWFLPTVFTILSLMSKEPGLIFLGLIALCDLLPLGDDQPTTKSAQYRRLGLSAFVMLAYFGIRAYVFGDIGGYSSYGSISISETLRLHGWENLKSGFMIAMAPVTSFVVPEEAPRTIFKAILGAGSAWILIAGFIGLGRQGFKKLAVVTIILVGPFLMTNLLSCLDERFINTRGCYISMFGMGLLFALSLRRMRSIHWAIGLCLLCVSMLLSWRVQSIYVEAGQGTEQVLTAMRAPLKNLRPTQSEKIVVLGFQHKSWFDGGFTAAGCLGPALQRPFTSIDYKTTLVAQEGKDPNRQFLTPFHQALPDIDNATVIGMRLDDNKVDYRFDLLHPLHNSVPQIASIEPLAPKKGTLLILDLANANTLKPRFRIRHLRPLIAEYRISLLAPTGRLVGAIAEVESSAPNDDGSIIVNLALLPLNVEQAQQFKNGKSIAWVVYGLNKKRQVTAQSCPTVYRVKSRGQ